MITRALTVAMFLAWVTPVPAQSPVTPTEHLGRPVGTDFQLADWGQVSSYFDTLAAGSPRVALRELGTSTEGRRFLVAFISSEENLSRLDELLALSRRIADPRGLRPEEREALLNRARAICFISCQMHSTEVAASEMSMELAHRIATSDEAPWDAVRREVIVAIAPCLNPDGLDLVTEWYRKIVGTPYESASLPEVYQRYAGHDNNRDWFMLSLKETRLVTRFLYRELFPTVYWDVHQQGSRGERLFVPPFRDPLNPTLDPGIVGALGALGSRAVLDLTREGYAGIATGVRYDMWWNGGNRSVPVRHNIIGILSEAASANLASPRFLAPGDVRGPSGIDTGNAPSNRYILPWTGGWWRIGDIVRYELALAKSFLGSLARERRYWVGCVLGAAERTLTEGREGSPRAWLVPPPQDDPGALRRLLDVLDAGGVEMESARAAFAADGRDYPAGTLILRRAQPYGRYLHDLFSVQRFPDGAPPYDVAGWTLPLLLGVHRVAVAGDFEASSARVTDIDTALAAFAPPAGAGTELVLPGADSRTYRAVAALLSAGIPTAFCQTEKGGAPGAWSPLVDSAGAGERARRIIDGVGATPVAADDELKLEDWVQVDALPRVGVYAPWVSSMDGGWLRWFLEHFELPFERVRNEQIRAGRLGDQYDVLVFPSLGTGTIRRGRDPSAIFPDLAGGLDPEGSVAIREFVASGGTLIACDRGSEYAIEMFDLPIVDASRGGRGDDAFSCPGSVLRTTPASTPWTVGLPATQAIFFSRSRAFRIDPAAQGGGSNIKTLLRFPPRDLLLSGWIRGEQHIADASAWMWVPHDQGQIHLFSFRPHYRSWSHSAFKLMLRAILIPPRRAQRDF